MVMYRIQNVLFHRGPVQYLGTLKTCAKNRENLYKEEARQNVVEKPMENVRSKGLISHNLTFNCV